MKCAKFSASITCVSNSDTTGDSATYAHMVKRTQLHRNERENQVQQSRFSAGNSDTGLFSLPITLLFVWMYIARTTDTSKADLGSLVLSQAFLRVVALARVALLREQVLDLSVFTGITLSTSWHGAGLGEANCLGMD